MKFCCTSALSQPQLLRGQGAQAPNPMGFPGTWPLPGPPPLMAPSVIMQPDSAPLPETARLLPLLPLRPPALSPVSSQPPGPPVSFPAAHPPGGPGAGTLQTTGILISHPGQSSSRGFLFLSHCLPVPSTPHYHLRNLFLKPMTWGSFGWSMLTESINGLQREVK